MRIAAIGVVVGFLAAGCDEGPVDVRIDWVRLEAGRFDMGSELGADAERPIHPVEVPAFELARTEVTVAQYRACVDAGRCDEPDSAAFCNLGETGRDEHPVNCVDWHRARAFSSWAGGRLPTEAEWEYAARSGGRDQEYPWGDEEASCARAVLAEEGDDPGETEGPGGCGEERSWPVCSKTAGNSAHGVCDLGGNVAEWVEDCFHDTYDGARADGGAWTDGCDQERRVTRGGSWGLYAAHCRAAHRLALASGVRSNYVGFRPARSIPDA